MAYSFRGVRACDPERIRVRYRVTFRQCGSNGPWDNSEIIEANFYGVADDGTLNFYKRGSATPFKSYNSRYWLGVEKLA